MMNIGLSVGLIGLMLGYLLLFFIGKAGLI